ncbi:MAG: DUF58 domain-containing protein [bacterium]
MLSPEIIKKIKKIHIHTSSIVNDVMAGEYESAFRGRGMEFEEVREYQPGDDIRDIDWNVTARMGHPFIKIYREERELTIMLMVDVSSSSQFGSIKELKNEVAAEIAAIFAFTAIRSNDKVGLIIFSDTIERYIPPKKGRGHVWRVIKEVIEHKPMKRSTDLVMALQYLNKVQKRKSVCFLISDFMCEGYEQILRVSRQHHDLIAISITDPREVELPKIGFIELEDAETGEAILIDTYDSNIRKGFSALGEKDRETRKQAFRAMNIDYVDIRTNRSYIQPIIRLFKQREKRI